MNFDNFYFKVWDRESKILRNVRSISGFFNPDYLTLEVEPRTKEECDLGKNFTEQRIYKRFLEGMEKYNRFVLVPSSDASTQFKLNEYQLVKFKSNHEWYMIKKYEAVWYLLPAVNSKEDPINLLDFLTINDADCIIDNELDITDFIEDLKDVVFEDKEHLMIIFGNTSCHQRMQYFNKYDFDCDAASEINDLYNEFTNTYPIGVTGNDIIDPKYTLVCFKCGKKLDFKEYFKTVKENPNNELPTIRNVPFKYADCCGIRYKCRSMIQSLSAEYIEDNEHENFKSEYTNQWDNPINDDTEKKDNEDPSEKNDTIVNEPLTSKILLENHYVHNILKTIDAYYSDIKLDSKIKNQRITETKSDICKIAADIIVNHTEKSEFDIEDYIDLPLGKKSGLYDIYKYCVYKILKPIVSSDVEYKNDYSKFMQEYEDAINNISITIDDPLDMVFSSSKEEVKKEPEEEFQIYDPLENKFESSPAITTQEEKEFVFKNRLQFVDKITQYMSMSLKNMILEFSKAKTHPKYKAVFTTKWVFEVLALNMDSFSDDEINKINSIFAEAAQKLAYYEWNCGCDDIGNVIQITVTPTLGRMIYENSLVQDTLKSVDYYFSDIALENTTRNLRITETKLNICKAATDIIINNTNKPISNIEDYINLPLGKESGLYRVYKKTLSDILEPVIVCNIIYNGNDRKFIEEYNNVTDNK